VHIEPVEGSVYLQAAHSSLVKCSNLCWLDGSELEVREIFFAGNGGECKRFRETRPFGLFGMFGTVSILTVTTYSYFSAAISYTMELVPSMNVPTSHAAGRRSLPSGELGWKHIA
jgi:hypothetical protein